MPFNVRKDFLEPLEAWYETYKIGKQRADHVAEQLNEEEKKVAYEWWSEGWNKAKDEAGEVKSFKYWIYPNYVKKFYGKIKLEAKKRTCRLNKAV